MLRIVSARGTRPEAIKMQPVEDALRAAGSEVLVWDSGQSPDLTGSKSAIIWASGVTKGIASAMSAFKAWLEAQEPVDAVLVQGDTATAFACALTAFLEGIPVGHVEAGLRTYASEPFPEEAFRRMIAPLARWHFCPDQDSEENLRREANKEYAVMEGVHVTGNPVIDTLPNRPLRVLATLHRRENWGARIGDALLALNQICADFDAIVTVIRHPNWTKALSFDPERVCPHVHFETPMSREDMVDALIEATDLVVTDSGGLQEEAAALGVPCLVLRTATERTALVANGAVTLIDPDDADALYEAVAAIARRRSVYGPRGAGRRIADILLKELRGDAYA
jgi:UDP-N-acetylglucosamine 2-epimerase (non-hydrolysing)